MDLEKSVTANSEIERLRGELVTLLKEKPDTLLDRQIHSRIVDELAGFRCESVETRVSMNRPKGDVLIQQAWVDLPLPVLQTPYAELKEILEELSPESGETFVDLGAAYGRLGLLLGLLYPGVWFLGYELIRERAEEGRRVLSLLGLHRTQMLTQDLGESSFDLKPAEYYFLYDFGAKPVVDGILARLQKIAGEKKIVVIARGRGSRSWIDRQHPWLCVVPPVHHEFYSIYRS